MLVMDGTTGGGGSGGGSINIFYNNNIRNTGTIQCNGGKGAIRYNGPNGYGWGQNGGAGSITIGNISTGTFVKDE